jgi:hypothetical protein
MRLGPPGPLLFGNRSRTWPFVTERTELGAAVTFEEYQQRAADCLRVAQETNDPTSRALLLEMAQAWVNLAERERARNPKSDNSTE